MEIYVVMADKEKNSVGKDYFIAAAKALVPGGGEGENAVAEQAAVPLKIGTLKYYHLLRTADGFTQSVDKKIRHRGETYGSIRKKCQSEFSRLGLNLENFRFNITTDEVSGQHVEVLQLSEEDTRRREDVAATNDTGLPIITTLCELKVGAQMTVTVRCVISDDKIVSSFVKSDVEWLGRSLFDFRELLESKGLMSKNLSFAQVLADLAQGGNGAGVAPPPKAEEQAPPPEAEEQAEAPKAGKQAPPSDPKKASPVKPKPAMSGVPRNQEKRFILKDLSKGDDTSREIFLINSETGTLETYVAKYDVPDSSAILAAQMASLSTPLKNDRLDKAGEDFLAKDFADRIGANTDEKIVVSRETEDSVTKYLSMGGGDRNKLLLTRNLGRGITINQRSSTWISLDFDELSEDTTAVSIALPSIEQALDWGYEQVFTWNEAEYPQYRRPRKVSYIDKVVSSTAAEHATYMSGAKNSSFSGSAGLKMPSGAGGNFTHSSTAKTTERKDGKFTTEHVYLLVRYVVPKVELLFPPESISLRKDFVEKVHNVCASFEDLRLAEGEISSSSQKLYGKLLKLMLRYGFYVPTGLTLGGVLYNQDIKKRKDTKALTQSLSALTSGIAGAAGFPIPSGGGATGSLSVSASKGSEDANQQQDGESQQRRRFSVQAIGGDPGCIGSSGDWIGSLKLPERWSAIEYTVAPILAYLPMDGSDEIDLRKTCYSLLKRHISLSTTSWKLSDITDVTRFHRLTVDSLNMEDYLHTLLMSCDRTSLEYFKPAEPKSPSNIPPIIS